MLTTSEVEETLHRFQPKIEEIRVICRLHGFPTGGWKDVNDLPLRLSQDSSFRSDVVETVRSLQSSRLNLPEVLDLLVVAAGGSAALEHNRELSEPLNSLGSFLANVGRWPGADFSPILAPGEVPANIHKFSRPQSTPAREESSEPDPQEHAMTDERDQTPSLESAQTDLSGAPSSEADVVVLSEIARALTRLELGNLELRAHLDSIDQRISRMEPLLESSAAVPVPQPSGAEPGDRERDLTFRDRSRISFTAVTARLTDSTRTEALTPPRPGPEEVTLEPVRSDLPHAELPPAELGQKSSSPLGTFPEDFSTGLEPIDQSKTFSQPAPDLPDPAGPQTDRRARFTPASASRFSRFSQYADPATHDSTSTIPAVPISREPVVAVSGEAAAMGTEAAAESNSIDVVAPRKSQIRRQFPLLATAILLITMVAAAVALYMRGVASGDADRASNPSGAIEDRPQTSSTGTPESAPLTSSPATPGSSSKVKVLDARSAFRSTASTEEPGSNLGFHPARNFVPASVMEGHLTSAPLPDQPRVPASSESKGIVVMEANISSTGRVEDVHVLGGSAALRFAAIDAVRTWQYKPYLQNGIPVEVRTIIRVDFTDHRAQPAERGAPFPP